VARLAILLLPLLLTACPKAVEPMPLRVVSYNLRHDVDWWEQRFPLIADEIVKLKPDLLGLQEVEVGIGQGETLRDMIRERDPALDYHLYRELKSGVAAASGEGIGLLSRRPLGPLARHDLAEGRVLIHARIDFGSGLSVDLFNTHLDSRGDDQHRYAQAKDVALYMDEQAAAGLSLLTGDLNDTPGSRAVQHLVDSGLEDAYRVKHGDRADQTGATSPILLRQEPVEQHPSRRIDYVLYRTEGEVNVEVSSAAVAFDQPDATGLYPSDHLGVVVDLAVTPAREE